MPLPDMDTCWACGGEGEYHDCGEDCCACADPEHDEMHECPVCGGLGELRAEDTP